MGQLGDGTVTDRLSPVQVPGLSGVVDIASGHYHSLALLADGTVRAWGYNSFGQLGNGATTSAQRTPVVAGPLTDVVAIAGGRDMSYALRSDGTVWGWGLNTTGQLGDGTTTMRTRPVRVGSLTGVTAITGGRDHGLAVRSDGTVWGWGDNTQGQVGDGSLTNRLSPVQVSGLSGAVEVAAGAYHSLARLSTGAVRSWGQNSNGQLGDGTTTRRTLPVAVPGATGATAIAAGRQHSLAIVANGAIRAWGSNATGQLGDGSLTDRTSAVTVGGITGAAEVSAGRDHTVALVPAAVTEPDITPPIFASDFADGFASWTTNTGLTVDATQGTTSPPSARGNPNATRAFAARNLSATYPNACISEQIQVSSLGVSVDLFRLRTATDGGIIRVYIDANRVLWLRSDSAGTQRSSGTAVPLNQWQTIELCGTVGTATTWTLYVNGTQRGTPWQTNTGTTPIGRVQIGDTAAKTWTINHDDVILDQTPG
jgi:hypothetical protein